MEEEKCNMEEVTCSTGDMHCRGTYNTEGKCNTEETYNMEVTCNTGGEMQQRRGHATQRRGHATQEGTCN